MSPSLLPLLLAVSADVKPPCPSHAFPMSTPNQLLCTVAVPFPFLPHLAALSQQSQSYFNNCSCTTKL